MGGRSADENPDWDLLPDYPAEFFGLSGEFDRKDLKRAYNRWIRRFKPERFPDEFQRIRAAFESVDDMLRYNTAEPASRLFPSPRPPSEDAATSRPLGVVDRLEREGAEGLFASLSASRQRTPHDYYCLAVLSDGVEVEQQGESFLEWICRGVEHHPHDSGLMRLLHAHCQAMAPDDATPALLERLAGLLSAAEFGYVTERLWGELVARTPFPQFRARFESCMRLLLRRDATISIPLVLRVARRAVFVADEQWLEEQLGLAWEERDTLWDEDVDLLELLLDYRRVRDDFLDGDDVRRDLDATIRAICECTEAEADRRFLEWRVRYRSRSAAIAEAIPFADESAEPALAVLQWYSADVEERLDEEHKTLNRHARVQKVRELGRRLDRLTDRSILGNGMYIVHAALLFGIPGLLIWLGVWLGGRLGLSGIGFWGALAAWVALCGVFAWKFLWAYVFVALDDALCRACYRKKWRGEALRFLSESQVAIGEIVEAFMEDKECSGVAFSSDLAACLASDPGLGLVSLIQNRR